MIHFIWALVSLGRGLGFVVSGSISLHIRLEAQSWAPILQWSSLVELSVPFPTRATFLPLHALSPSPPSTHTAAETGNGDAEPWRDTRWTIQLSCSKQLQISLTTLVGVFKALLLGLLCSKSPWNLCRWKKSRVISRCSKRRFGQGLHWSVPSSGHY